MQLCLLKGRTPAHQPYHQPQTSQYHMQRSLRHFDEQLVGACSSMKKNEEREQYDMPIHTRIQGRPSAIPHSPPIKQTKNGFTHKLSHGLCCLNYYY